MGVAPLVDLQTIVNDLFVFLSCLDNKVVDYSERGIVKAARRIERIDLYLRFDLSADAILFKVNRLQGRIIRTWLTYDRDVIPRLKEMLSGERVPYADVVHLIESMLGV